MNIKLFCYFLCGFILSFLAKRLLLIAFFSPLGDYPEYLPLCDATTFFSEINRIEDLKFVLYGISIGNRTTKISCHAL